MVACSTNINDAVAKKIAALEGGVDPVLQCNEEPLELLSEAVKTAGFELGKDWSKAALVTNTGVEALGLQSVLEGVVDLTSPPLSVGAHRSTTPSRTL